jgi:hypothetical protein
MKGYYASTLALRLILAMLDDKGRPAMARDRAAYDATYAEVLANPGCLPALVEFLSGFAAESFMRIHGDTHEAARFIAMSLATELDALARGRKTP